MGGSASGHERVLNEPAVEDSRDEVTDIGAAEEVRPRQGDRKETSGCDPTPSGHSGESDTVVRARGSITESLPDATVQRIARRRREAESHKAMRLKYAGLIKEKRGSASENAFARRAQSANERSDDDEESSAGPCTKMSSVHENDAGTVAPDRIAAGARSIAAPTSEEAVAPSEAAHPAESAKEDVCDQPPELQVDAGAGTHLGLDRPAEKRAREVASRVVAAASGAPRPEVTTGGGPAQTAASRKASKRGAATGGTAELRSHTVNRAIPGGSRAIEVDEQTSAAADSHSGAPPAPPVGEHGTVAVPPRVKTSTKEHTEDID